MSESRNAGFVPGEYDILPRDEWAQEQFWLQWGEEAGFERQQFGLMWDDARDQHTDKLQRHNFAHSQEVLWDVMCLADICEANGISVNRKALMAAALFHDAGLHHKDRLKGYRSKEEYAATMLTAWAPKYGLDTEDTAVGIQAIRATERGVVPVSIEDKIMVRADLMNVGGDYNRSLVPTTELLMQEAQTLEESGTKIGWLTFKRSSIKAIADYLIYDLSLGPFDDKKWLKQAVGNLLRMIAETAAEEKLSVTDLVKELGSTAVSNLPGLHRLSSSNTDRDQKSPNQE